MMSSDHQNAPPLSLSGCTQPPAGTSVEEWSPANVNPAEIGAFFDVDETLVRGATAFWAAQEMFARRLFGIRDLLFAARQTFQFVLFGENLNKIDDAVDRAVRVLEGNSVQELLEIGENVFETYFLPRVYQPTYERLKKHTAAGHQVWLISATPWIIAEVFAKRLGLAGGVGTKMRVAGGLLQGGIEGNFVHGPAKVKVLEDIASQKGLRLEDSWAYSDSANDIPLLSAVGHPVAVNPDRELAHFARAHGWEVLEARARGDILKRELAKAGLAVSVGLCAWLVARKLWRRTKR